MSACCSDPPREAPHKKLSNLQYGVCSESVARAPLGRRTLVGKSLDRDACAYPPSALVSQRPFPREFGSLRDRAFRDPSEWACSRGLPRTQTHRSRHSLGHSNFRPLCFGLPLRESATLSFAPLYIWASKRSRNTGT